jgi:hypothetical protein
MDSAFETELAQSELTVQEFLKRRHPAWNLVGRVHFNLAENRKDEDAPFAFLATYTTRLSAEAKPQHLPLGKALQEYSGARNRERLLSLLMPVQRAAEHCAWLRAMVDAGEIFHPLRWSPQQAVQFLRDVPALESAGVLVRMPASWRMNRPARPQVKATVGSNAPSHLGMDALLDFRIEVTLDGENLKAAEIEQLLAHSDGLALIRGKWVDVDHERLSRTLEQSEAIERRAVTDGLSFGEAMRMLAGTGFAGDGAAARADVGATACFRRRVRSNSTAVVRTGRACASTLRRLFMELAPGSTKILSFFSCCAAWMKTNSSPLPDRIFRFRRGHPVLRKRLTIVTSRPCSGSRSPRLLDRIYPPPASSPGGSRPQKGARRLPRRRCRRQSKTSHHERRGASPSLNGSPCLVPGIGARGGGVTVPHEHLHMCRRDDRRGSLVPNLLNSFMFSNGYGEPDWWFESRSLRHKLNI